MAAAKKPGTLTASFDPRTATPDSAQKVVELMLQMAGCSGCGRLSKLQLDFASNAGETKIPGVTSVEGGD